MAASQHSNDEQSIENLKQRLANLEHEHQRLQALLERSLANEPLETNPIQPVLYVDMESRQIIDASARALTVLGYSLDQLTSFVIDDLEHRSLDNPEDVHWESVSYVYEYAAQYRHQQGHLTPMRVQKREVTRNGQPVYQYHLQDHSLYSQFSNELARREGSSYQFSEKLKILNEIIIALDNLETFDDVCRSAIEFGIGKLGFDRMSLWFLEEGTRIMHGTYGVDEVGNIRDEHSQSWDYDQGFINDFARGERNVHFQQDAPLYNQKSEIISYGWHISAPIVDGQRFIGFITVDNYLKHQPMQTYEAEILRLYGASIGHVAASLREQETARLLRQQEVDLQLETQRVRILENFVRDVGHEFRTPLSIISTSAYLIGRGSDPERRKEHIAHIGMQVSYLNKMIDDMLYIARLDSTLLLHKTEVNLTQLVEEILEIKQLTEESALRQIRWQRQLAPGAMIAADADKLQRAIREILKNAIQFSPVEGSIRVQLETGARQVSLGIRDEGIGISPEEQEAVFQRFYRLDSARTTPGTGLGLSIARLIVEAHGGTITVKSAMGEGSEFIITLPL